MEGVTNPIARFDAADGRGRSFELREPVGEIVAWTVEDVVPAIEKVADAAVSGLHAGGFIAYEAASGFDPNLITHRPHTGLPLVWFGIFRARVEVSPINDSASTGDPTDLAGAATTSADWRATLGPREYAARVERIRRLIAAGDTYQVNLTFPLVATGSVDGLYAELLLAQRTAYGAYLSGAFGTVVSASPELFFSWRDDELELRPMKGTRPRGLWSAEDDRLARELVESPKERAENLMIVDLLRNDAGRVAETGTVLVPRLFEVERYPTVHQLTSTITARTPAGTTLAGLLTALFPSGSVTGAPKIRTMEIIREMEDGPRGVYTGAIGFVSPGETVFNVPIRTIWQAPAGVMRLGVGSGITYDSEAGAEYAECIQKSAFVRHRSSRAELLETMGWDPASGVRRLERHLARIAASARYFGIPFDQAAAERALDDAIHGAITSGIAAGSGEGPDPGIRGRQQVLAPHIGGSPHPSGPDAASLGGGPCSRSGAPPPPPLDAAPAARALDALAAPGLEASAAPGLDAPAASGLDAPAASGLDAPAASGLDAPAAPDFDVAGTSPGRPPALRVRLIVDSDGTPRADASRYEPITPPLRACIDSRPIDRSEPWVYHKTTRRHEYDTRRAAHHEFDDVLMMNERGELTEFTTGNVIIRIDGKSYTPPIEAGLLPGIARAEWLERGELTERTLTPADLHAADGVYHLNSLRGATPVEMSL